VAKSVFPDVDFPPIAEGCGFEAATIRTLGDVHKIAPKLWKPDGPLFLDCKINADVAALFMSEFAHFEGRH
jgi:acetolactate synthase I/II/III large subunit